MKEDELVFVIQEWLGMDGDAVVAVFKNPDDVLKWAKKNLKGKSAENYTVSVWDSEKGLHLMSYTFEPPPISEYILKQV